MHRDRPAEHSHTSAQGREAGSDASRPTPLTLIAGAVAGGDLRSVAAAAAAALSCPVAIAVPALGAPVLAPEQPLAAGVAAALLEHAGDMIAERTRTLPEPIVDSVAVQIADEVVGIVGALRPAPQAAPGADRMTAGERRAWLQAAAAAASVNALIRELHGAEPGGSAADLLAELAVGPPVDLQAFLARCRRLGVELTGGGIAVCARRPARDGAGAELTVADRALAFELRHRGSALAEPRGRDRLIALVADESAERMLSERLLKLGLAIAVSAPRRDPALLHEALVEAELLAELGLDQHTAAGLRETYRLLIGVLLRDRAELEDLHDRTVAPLSEYDSFHDTELVGTLRAFLSHDGSTTGTAEAMALHRHTVGYRLSRVAEVSGLSPYESDGRERLSLGIKAQTILEAQRRRQDRARPGSNFH